MCSINYCLFLGNEMTENPMFTTQLPACTQLVYYQHVTVFKKKNTPWDHIMKQISTSICTEKELILIYKGEFRFKLLQ